MRAEDTFDGRQRHAEFLEKELVMDGWVAIICDSLTKEFYGTYL
jgi:hypothetical protein